MYIIQLFDDNFFYIKNILNNLNNSLKIAEYLYFIYLESIEYGKINFY